MIESIAFIGAGNMGGSIIKGLVSKGIYKAKNLWVADPSTARLEALSKECRGLNVTTDNTQAASNAKMVVVAVKPWLVEEVLESLDQLLKPDQIICSIAAGVDLSTLRKYIQYGPAKDVPLFRVIPNTAIAIGQSMSFIAADEAPEEIQKEIYNIFAQLGKAILVEESGLEVGMAVASCGIAYAMRYVRAAMEGAIQLGMTPANALESVLQTVKGAILLLETTKEHPEVAIDKVTTAGGYTIKGLNAMESAGFTASVIDGLVKSKK